MPYAYATSQEDYSDYASGRVLYSMPGQPAFPVRLVSEIFQRCLAAREAAGQRGTCTLYDPCCGGAYHLTTLAYLHWPAIDRIVASDIDPDAVALARRNLALLTPEGLENRRTEIAEMLESYGKASHAEALDSVRRLKSRLLAGVSDHAISTSVFRADATEAATMAQGLQGETVDIVLTDIPYGHKSSWQLSEAAASAEEPALWQMLEALRSVVSPETLIAIATGKRQKVAHRAFRRIDRFNLGKRRVEIVRPA